MDYLRQLEFHQYAQEQKYEIAKAVKALHDYCDAARKISPEFQREAFRQCGIAVLEEMNKNSY